MRKLFFPLVLLVGYFGASAQNNAADSLKQLLNKEKEDTSRAKLFVQLSRLYIYTKPDTALVIASHALELARQLHFKSEEATSLRIIAAVFVNTGNYAKALELTLESLKIAEEIKNNELIGRALNTLADIYFYQGDLRRSLNYAFRALSIFSMLGDIERLTQVTIGVGDSYEKNNQLDSALIYGRRAYNMASAGNDIGLKSISLINLGNVFLKLNNPDSAMIYYRAHISYNEQLQDEAARCETYFGMANVFFQKKQTDSSLYFAKLSFMIAKQTGFTQYVLASGKFLTTYYQSAGNIDSAYVYQTAIIEAKDSLFSQQKTNQIQNMTYDETLRQKQIKEIQREAREQLKQNAFIGGLGTLLLVALLLYRNNRQKQKAKTKIEKAYLELESTQALLVQKEKMASLGELTAGIAHEIQNPLNFVNNFAEVSNEMIAEMKTELAADSYRNGNSQLVLELVDDISQNLEKINHHGKRADAIVKGMLQHSQSSSGVKELTDINALADEYVRLSYHGLRAKDNSFNATIKTDFDNSIGNIKIVSQDIGRVLLNIYNNAFYAVNEKAANPKSQFASAGYEPTVKVSTKKLPGRVQIRVEDNGNGIPLNIIDKIFQPFFTTKPTGQGTGLGLSLSYDIVTKAHNGQLLASSNKEGAIFTIELPA